MTGEIKEAATSPIVPLKILVIDDEDMPRALVVRMLKKDGHLAESAESGANGVARCRELQFDLVITDRAMDDMNGDEVARMIKSFFSTTKVILFTGYGDMMKARGERPESVDLVLDKPVSAADMRAAIANVMRM